MILARASAIPVLSGLPLDAIARYAGQPAVLDAQCGVLAINPNDAVSGYYQVARERWRINAKNNRRRLPRWPIPVITSVLILRRISAPLWKRGRVCREQRGRCRAVPYRNALYQ
ncbi:hypothetical protein ACNKHU_14545 [Shigella flexneri]